MKFCNSPIFPLSAAALAKMETLFLAFIFFQRKKINAFQVLKSLPHKSYSHSFYLPARVGNVAFCYNNFNSPLLPALH